MEIRLLKEAISSPDVKAVSFDIFDTLLSRPCLFPYVLFRIAGKRCGFEGDFESVRREAEHKARSNCPEGDDDVTFDTICEELSLMIGAEEVGPLKQAEMRAEYDYLYPRKPIDDVFHYALETGKQVIIVSDMYLPVSFLEAVLRKNGYTGYQKIYISNEYLLTKHTKRLFGRVIDDLAKERISPSEILHIGDNAYADVQNASECGLKTFHIECGVSAMKKSKWFRTLEQPLCEENLFWLGLIANFFFDPFRERKEPMPETLDGLIKALLQSRDQTQLNLITMLCRDRIFPEEILSFMKKA